MAFFLKGGGGGGKPLFTTQKLGKEMVNWYSLVQTEMIWHLLVSFKVFMGRFDHRELQCALRPPGNAPPWPYGTPVPPPSNANGRSRAASLSSHETSSADSSATGAVDAEQVLAEAVFAELGVHDHRHAARGSADGSFWFDFMADCGDGWNPSYAIARALAQPRLPVRLHPSLNISRNMFSHVLRSSADKSDNQLELPRGKHSVDMLELPRGNMLILGGDLAYPAPTAEEYESRFFAPFQAAMPPPAHYRPEAISYDKKNMFASYQQASVTAAAAASLGVGDRTATMVPPVCYAIPGNHGM